MKTFDPTASETCAIGTVRCRKLEGTPSRYVVELERWGEPPEELHCGGSPECAYNYYAGVLTGVHRASTKP